jgi:spermidine synthase
MSRELRAGALAFVAAGMTLVAQVAVHRIVSAKMLNNFAFLVLSLTMLGFAASGAWLSRNTERWRDPLGETMSVGASLFALGLVSATAVLYPAPPVEDWGGGTRLGVLLAFVSCVPFGLLYAAAFAGSGLVLGVLLSSPALSTRRLYALDLVGSAVGAFAVIPAVSTLGAERTAVLAGAGLLAATVVLAPPRALRTRVGVAIVTAALAVAMLFPHSLFRLRYPRQSFLGQTQAGNPEYALELVAWDPVARIEVSRVPPPVAEAFPWPCLFGPDQELLARFRRVITQNNNAFTYAPAYQGDPGTLRGLEQTVYAAAYQAGLVRRPRVLVIGVGGGIDVLTALRFDASSVEGVEVNAATLHIVRHVYRDYFRAWVDDPRVRLVLDDGRHYLASRPDRFDLVQLSGVDSVSGTPGAAHVFSESYLYTAEAFDLFLSRLTPDGVLNVMRPDSVPSRDGLRLVATTIEALERRGIDRPADHVMVIADRSGSFAAVLAQLRPFTSQQVERAAAWTENNPYLVLAAAPARVPSAANAYAAALALPTSRLLRATLRRYPWDVVPVADDRPFFFHNSRWTHLWPAAGGDPGAPVMELGLLASMGVCALAAIAFVYVPLRGRRSPARAPNVGTGRLVVFFGSIGLGYMAIEMALIQKLGLLLGHPNYALSVVLASLLLTTGVGSLLSGSIVRRLGGSLRFVSYVLAFVLLAELLLVFPRFQDWVALPATLRVALAVLLVAPFGCLLGTFFPTGLERLKRLSPDEVAWAWGVNGMASVVSPPLSVAVSMTAGMSMLLLAALPVYLVAGFSAPSGGAPEPAGPR